MEAFVPFFLYLVAVIIGVAIFVMKVKNDGDKYERKLANYNSDLSSLNSSLSRYGFNNAKLIPNETFFKKKAGERIGYEIWYHISFIFIWDSTYTRFGVYDTKNKSIKVYQKKDLLDYSLFKNGTMVPRGNTASVILGGAVFGAVGALAGAAKAASSTEMCTDLTIEIILRNCSEPRVSLPLLNGYSSPTSLDYRNRAQMALDILAVLKNIKEA